MNVLVVEDQKELSSFLKQALEKEGMNVTLCESVEEVLEHGYETSHDIIVLDLMLKGKRGEELIVELRKNKSNIPILVLSALGQINTKIEAINQGADDYLTKPFHAQELIARLKALYRRYLETGFQDVETFGEFNFYRKQNIVHRGDKDITLTKKEGELLELLIRNRGKTVPLDDILKKVWKAKAGYHSNIVQATVRRLRKKIDSGFEHKLIHNRHGIGYTLQLPNNDLEEVHE